METYYGNRGAIGKEMSARQIHLELDLPLYIEPKQSPCPRRRVGVRVRVGGRGLKALATLARHDAVLAEHDLPHPLGVLRMFRARQRRQNTSPADKGGAPVWVWGQRSWVPPPVQHAPGVAFTCGTGDISRGRVVCRWC